MAIQTLPRPTPDSGSSNGVSQLDLDLQKVEQTKSNRELLEYVNKCFEDCRKARHTQERQWFINLSFFFGKQWVSWLDPNGVPELARLYEPKAPPWRVRLVINRIRPMIRTEMSKVLKEKPTAYVIPASDDESDVVAARAGEQIFEHLWRTMEMNPEMWQAQFWRAVCGIGYTKDWWDPNALDNRSSPPGTTLRGKICVETISPFHLYVPNQQVWRIESQPYLIHLSAKSPDEVEQAYGKKVEPNSSGNANVLDNMYVSALNLEKSPKEYVAVKEMWAKPCKRFPKGALITWTEDTLLQMTDGLPYEHGEFPFTDFRGIPSGKFYTDSTIVDMIPIQKEFNRSRSQIVESKNQMSRPQLMAPKGSVDARKITSEPGQVIFYQPGFTPPTPITLQNLPSYVLQDIDRMLADFNDISGQHEISRGSNPTGVTAATALSYLQEQDDTMLAPIIESVEYGTQKLGRHFLSHVHQYWEASHLISVVGENRMFEAYTFTKKDIKGNTDLNIQSGSAMPRSLAAKQAFILELAKLGLIDPQKALKYLEMAETGRMYEESMVDNRQAQRENLKMVQGTVVPANSWDNHEAHIEEHNKFRKMQEFENSDPAIKTVMEQHVALHRVAIGLPPDMNPEQLAAAQTMMAGMPGGGAPGIGAPGSPVQQELGGGPPGEMAGTAELPPPGGEGAPSGAMDMGPQQ